MLHPTAEVQGATVGAGTSIWQHCVVLPGAVLGRDCNVNAHCLIEGGGVLGDRVTVKSGVYIWSGVTLEDDVFVGPNATFTNDPRPRSKRAPAEWIGIRVCRGASIGAGVTVIAGVTIGEYALIGAGSVVTRDIPSHGLWYGNPARPHGFVCVCGERLNDEGVCICNGCGLRFGPATGESGLIKLSKDAGP